MAALLVAAGAAPAAARPPGGCRARPAIAAHVVSGEAADRMRLQPGTTRGAHSGEYALVDGRQLVQDAAGEAGALYGPEAFKLRRRALDEERRFRRVGAGESFHLLRGLIDDGEGFLAHVPALRAELRRRLAGEGLDPGAGGAPAELAARWREAGCRPDAELFRELTAEAGERARESGGGRWSTRVGEGGVIEPVVEISVGAEARELAPWRWAEALLDGGADLDALVREALAPARPAAPAQKSERPIATAVVDGAAGARAPMDAGASDGR